MTKPTKINYLDAIIIIRANKDRFCSDSTKNRYWKKFHGFLFLANLATKFGHGEGGIILVFSTSHNKNADSFTRAS